MRIIDFQMKFYGPMSMALARMFNFEEENGKLADKYYIYYFVGKGQSKAVAAAKALAKFRATKVKFSEVEALVTNSLPPASNFIEAPEHYLDVYCTIEVYCEEI